MTRSPLGRRSARPVALVTAAAALGAASGLVLGRPSVAGAASGPPAPVSIASPATSPITFTIRCDNGHRYSTDLQGGGSAQFPGVPAGTRCRAVEQPRGQQQAFAPVPGGGVTQVTFGPEQLSSASPRRWEAQA